MWLNPILQDMLRHIFQSCILESNQEILDLIQKVCNVHPHLILVMGYFYFNLCLITVSHVKVWGELLRQAPQQYVVAASCPWMGAWLCLMMQAPHIPIDLNMLLEVKARSKVSSRLVWFDLICILTTPNQHQTYHLGLWNRMTIIWHQQRDYRVMGT